MNELEELEKKYWQDFKQWLAEDLKKKPFPKKKKSIDPVTVKMRFQRFGTLAKESK